jgi:DNA repair exonuclease SbcCD ATPase subunit
MQIKLNTIKLENFKGQKSFEFSPDGQNASIQAENGVGKTTIYDGWLWLSFGKDSNGKADFNVRPLDENNEPIKGLVVAVEADIAVTGNPHVILRKEQHEKIVKGQLKGYETICSIDEVPKKVSEFQEFITNLCPEELFRQLTDLEYFNGKMHWSARRKVLLDVAGKIPKPAGFERLLSNLDGRSLDDYEKVMKDRKRAYDDERKDINPRIDELQRGLDEYVQDSKSEANLRKQRTNAQDAIDALNKQRDELLASEKQRQKLIDQINHLTCEKLHRESQLKNDTSGQKKLLDERANLEREHANKTQELVDLQNLIRQAKSAIDSAQNQIESSQLTLRQIRDEYKKVDSPNCSLCGQEWPMDKPKPGLADIESRGNKVKAAIDDTKARKADLQDELNKLLAEEKAEVEELKTAESAKNKRIAKIDEALKNRVVIDPGTDDKWIGINSEIEKLQKQLGKPVADQLEEIESNVKIAQEKLNEINTSLNQADSIEKSRKRIGELEAREKELAQLIADTEKEIDRIMQYKMAESKMIEAAVNDRFRHIKFKLFDYYLNGEINDKVCEAVLNGVPYPDMSSGQKILAGIDVINTLSDHYGVSVPLFIDHAESVTYPIEADSQTILLRAVPGVKELQVSIAKEAGKAVA